MDTLLKDKDIILDMYFIQKKSLTKIALDYKCSRTTIKRFLQKLGCVLRSKLELGQLHNRKYAVDPEFFNSIDSELKAYLLGVITADGTILADRGVLRLELKAEDGYIVKLLRDSICPNKPLEHLFFNKNPSIRVSISSRTLVENLSLWGLRNRKTYNHFPFPTIPSSMYKHYIRGFFDGDGCASLSSGKYGVSRYISFESSNEKFLFSIRNIFEQELGLSTKQIRLTAKAGSSSGMINGSELVRTINSYRLNYYSIPDIEKIYDYFYSDANYFMTRKKEKMELCKLTSSKLKELKTF